jgi:hypothetical protein
MPDSVNTMPNNGLVSDKIHNLHVIDYPQDADIRYICTVNLEEVNEYSEPSFRSELDSHADTCVVGQAYLKVEESMRLVSVSESPLQYGGTSHWAIPENNFGRNKVLKY